MHAFLITGNDSEYKMQKVKRLAKEKNAKMIPFVLQKIDDARNLKNFTKFNFDQKTAIVIKDIDQATNEALNAFLKNLEEPNENLIYILTASNLENVLPTIASRCEIVKSPSTNHHPPITADDHKHALDIKERDIAIKFIEDLIDFDYKNRDYTNMEHYLKTLKNLKNNGNVSLQMLNLVVRMDSHE